MLQLPPTSETSSRTNTNTSTLSTLGHTHPCSGWGWRISICPIVSPVIVGKSPHDIHALGYVGMAQLSEFHAMASVRLHLVLKLC